MKKVTLLISVALMASLLFSCKPAPLSEGSSENASNAFTSSESISSELDPSSTASSNADSSKANSSKNSSSKPVPKTDTSSTNKNVKRIYPVKEFVPQGENLYKKSELQLGFEGSSVETYTSAPIGADGFPSFDDGDRFFIRALIKGKQYNIFEEERVQLGGPVAEIFFDKNGVLHIVLRDVRTAQYKIYDFSYNAKESCFERTTIMDNTNINYFGQ